MSNTPPETALRPLPPETLAWLRQTARLDGGVTAQVLLHLLERLEALEKKYETQRLATLEWGKDVDKLMRWSDDHLKRIMALEQRPIPGTVELAAQPTPEVAPVVTDDELIDLWHEVDGLVPALRAVYNLGRQHGAAQPPIPQPAPPAAPVGGLVERVANVLGHYGDGTARAAIREVAAWFDLQGQHACSLLLREEANR